MAAASHSHHRLRRILPWIVGVIVCLALAIFIASFFLDRVIGPRIETAMNAKLKVYHVSLTYPHLQLIDGVLTLKGVKISQQAHPLLPIADIAEIRFHIDWSSLAAGHVVASTGVFHQAKELMIGAASHVFRNQSTQKIATNVDIGGKLSGPNVSTWQAVDEVLRNAFIRAILPGFDRVAGPNPAAAK
jgi:hypothetical protein